MMNPNHDLEERLDRLAREIQPGNSQQFTIMNRIRSLPSRRTRWWMLPVIGRMRPAWSATFLLGVVAMGWYFVLNNSPGFYAQALDAIARATSVHAIGESKQDDGSWEKGMEVWYHRDFGIVEWQNRKGVTRTRIDNKQYQWRYSSDNPIVVKTRSEDPIGVIEEIFDLEKFHAIFPDRPREEITDARETFCIYSSIHGDKNRMDAWLDRQGRIRKWEKFKKSDSGEWDKYSIATLEYDVPIDRSRFEPSLNDNSIVKDWSKVIDASALLDDLFGLKNAIYQREEFGLLFAVHDIQRLDNGSIFLRTSMRPSEKLLQELGSIRSFEGQGEFVYGDYQLDSSWKRLPDGTERYYQPYNLAYLNHNGLYAQWTILIPKGNQPETRSEVELSLYWYTREKWQERLKNNGETWYSRFRPLTVLELPKSSNSWNGLLNTLYETGLQLEPAVHQMGFYKASVPDPEGKEGHSMRMVVKPSQLSFAAFVEENRKEYEHLK